MDETYERILLNIDELYKQEAQAALTWLVASQRVLTVEELAEAVSIETDSGDSFDPSNRLFDPNTICNVLSGLVSLVNSNRSLGPANIRLAHFSVEEYLVSDRLAKSRASHFHIPFRISHIRLAAASLIYLQWAKDFLREEMKCPMWNFSDIVKQDQSSGGLLDKVPLLAYTCKFWYLHVRKCEGSLPEREIRLVKDFLECQERISFFERATYGESDDAADNGCHSSRHSLFTDDYRTPWHMRAEPKFIASPLYHAARLGLVDLVSALLEDTDRSNVSLQSLTLSQPMSQASNSGTFGDELRIACFYGHMKIVEMLLNAGSDAEAVGGAFKTAIGACMQSWNPNPGIIQLLLERVETIHPDVEWIIGWVLRWAAMEGHLPIVSTVMSKVDRVGPQRFTWTRDYFHHLRLERRFETIGRSGRKDTERSQSYPRRGTAPYEAAFAGHYEILSLLISDWSDIDEIDCNGRTSLYWAAFNGHTDIVRLLLQHGARTRILINSYEWTPIYWAAFNGHTDIVRLLLQHGARTRILINSYE